MGITFGAVQSILTDILGMSKVLARWVPPMLSDDQKRHRLDNSRYLLSRYEDDPDDLIEQDVTQNEPWVHHFDPLCILCRRFEAATPENYKEEARKTNS